MQVQDEVRLIMLKLEEKSKSVKVALIQMKKMKCYLLEIEFLEYITLKNSLIIQLV